MVPGDRERGCEETCWERLPSRCDGESTSTSSESSMSSTSWKLEIYVLLLQVMVGLVMFGRVVVYLPSVHLPPPFLCHLPPPFCVICHPLFSFICHPDICHPQKFIFNFGGGGWPSWSRRSTKSWSWMWWWRGWLTIGDQGAGGVQDGACHGCGVGGGG